MINTVYLEKAIPNEVCLNQYVRSIFCNTFKNMLQKDEDDDIWKKSAQISHSNMKLTYACIGTWLGIFLVMLLWEFIYWRPRNVIPQVPKALGNFPLQGSIHFHDLH